MLECLLGASCRPLRGCSDRFERRHSPHTNAVFGARR
jgi:hypothetical protein